MAPVKGKGTPAVGIGAEASDELVKMRATVSQMQEEMSELVRVRNKLETENLKLRTENTALQTQNARLLAQAEARARLMQSIQSTLGTGDDDGGEEYDEEEGEYAEEGEYEGQVVDGVYVDEDGNEYGYEEEGEDLVPEYELPPAEEEVVSGRIRTIDPSSQGLPSPALTGTPSLSSIGHAHPPPNSQEEPPDPDDENDTPGDSDPDTANNGGTTSTSNTSEEVALGDVHIVELPEVGDALSDLSSENEREPEPRGPLVLDSDSDSDDSLSSLSEDEDAPDDGRVRRSHRAKTEVTSYNYRQRQQKRPRSEMEEDAMVGDSASAGPSLQKRKKPTASAAAKASGSKPSTTKGGSSGGKPVLGKGAKRTQPTKSVKGGKTSSVAHSSKSVKGHKSEKGKEKGKGKAKEEEEEEGETISAKRQKRDPGYYAARKRRETLAEAKLRQEMADDLADWPFRTKKAGCYTNWVQCNTCKRWIHHGCAGIVPGDIRLAPKAKYICPPCGNGEKYKRKPGDVAEDKCFRPDCGHKDD